MANPNFFATTVTATTTFQKLGTLLAAAGLDITDGAVMSEDGFIRNLSTSINLLIGTGNTAPTSFYMTVGPTAAIPVLAGLNTNQVWVASASSTVAVDFVEGAGAYQSPPNGAVNVTNNVIPKGSSNTLVNSSISDDGTTVSSTEGILSSSTAGIGYTTGAGTSVIQGSSRTTTVVASTACGTITLFSAAGSSTPFSFTVTNTKVTARDTIIVHQRTGTDLYNVIVTAVTAGSFRLTVTDLNGTTTEQPEISFAVIKGVNA